MKTAKKLSLFIILFVALCTVENYGISLAQSPWPMFQHDPGRSGQSDYLGPTSSPQIIWIYDEGSNPNDSPPNPLYGYPIIGADGTIYISIVYPVSKTGILALNPDGTKKWFREESVSPFLTLQADGSVLPDNTTSGANAEDGAVYYGEESVLYAFDGEGNKKWERGFEFEDRYPGRCVPRIPEVDAPTIGKDGIIYVVIGNKTCNWDGDYEDHLYAINSNNEVLWNVNVGGYGTSRPIISPEGTVYITDLFFGRYAWGPSCYLKAIAGGEVKWSLNLWSQSSPNWVSLPIVDFQGNVYLTVNKWALGVDKNGIKLWEIYLPDTPSNWHIANMGLALSKEGVLYLSGRGAILALYAAPIPPTNLPRPPGLVTHALSIAPQYSVYPVGERITAQFALMNAGTTPVVLKVVTVGGRGPDGEVVDFHWQEDVTLGPNARYNYVGDLILPGKPGTYHFFCTYQTEDGYWNPSVDLGPGLTDDDRVKDIQVAETVIGAPREYVFEATNIDLSGCNQWGATLKAILIQKKLALNPNDPKVSLLNDAIVLAHRLETSLLPPRDAIRDADLTGTANYWATFWGIVLSKFMGGVPGVKDACMQWGFDIAEALYLKDLYMVRIKQSPVGELTVVHKQGEEGSVVNFYRPLGGIIVTVPLDLGSCSIYYKIGSDVSAEIKSPAELRVYDSQGRATGLIDGEVWEQIPGSMYGGYEERVTILFSDGPYCYEVRGVETGTYELVVIFSQNGEATTFPATNIPTSPNTIHQYSIDWDVLSQGGKGAIIQIDSDGNGIFEQTITTGSEFIGRPVRVSVGACFYPETVTYRASFSMDVTGPISPSGWLKYYYTRTRMNFVSTGITAVSASGNMATISGTGTVNGVGGYTFTATVTNGTPDSFAIVIKKQNGATYYSAGPKNISGGDLVIQ